MQEISIGGNIIPILCIQGIKLWRNSPTHNKDEKYIVKNPIPNPSQINKSITLNK